MFELRPVYHLQCEWWRLEFFFEIHAPVSALIQRKICRICREPYTFRIAHLGKFLRFRPVSFSIVNCIVCGRVIAKRGKGLILLPLQSFWKCNFSSMAFGLLSRLLHMIILEYGAIVCSISFPEISRRIKFVEKILVNANQ